MSEPSEIAIRSILSDDETRLIAGYCKEPHTSAEIVEEVKRRDAFGFGRDYYESSVASNLSRLENAGAITFADGKWKTVKIALTVLAKYFGI